MLTPWWIQGVQGNIHRGFQPFFAYFWPIFTILQGIFHHKVLWVCIFKQACLFSTIQNTMQLTWCTGINIHLMSVCPFTHLCLQRSRQTAWTATRRILIPVQPVPCFLSLSIFIYFRLGNLYVNPRFHLIDIKWNLTLLQKIPNMNIALNVPLCNPDDRTSTYETCYKIP